MSAPSCMAAQPFLLSNLSPPSAIYTLSLHDALPICEASVAGSRIVTSTVNAALANGMLAHADEDRKSTRLNSSHTVISYAVFCLKKKARHHTRRSSDLRSKEYSMADPIGGQLNEQYK